MPPEEYKPQRKAQVVKSQPVHYPLRGRCLIVGLKVKPLIYDQQPTECHHFYQCVSSPGPRHQDRQRYITLPQPIEQ